MKVKIADMHSQGQQSEPRFRTTVGICLGASTISAVELRHEPNGSASITRVHIQAHEGNPKQALRQVLTVIQMETVDGIAATGRHLRRFLNLTSIPEPRAVEAAYPFVKPPGVECPAVVSAGGETFMVYALNRSGRIINVITGNKCASGTGEFFLQQLRRLDASLDEAAAWSVSESPYPVSGRCSVFCKSDCTHATNKGVPRERVTAGLCQMMANKILELLKKIPRKNIMLTGGTAQNSMMVEYLRREIPGLVVPPEAPYFEALGAALWASENQTKAYPGIEHLFRRDATSFDRLPHLDQGRSMVTFETVARGHIRPGDDCIVGLDVGSTTTKAVLLSTEDDAILATVYLRTNGDPVGASRKCYAALLAQIEKRVDPAQITITGLGVCGSGRQIAGLHALTDAVINEIIAHATAAVHFDPRVDTIFEIGGQDAKYTYLVNGVPSDYAMNEACSAGTGSFLEESAWETLGIEMETIAGVALEGRSPPNFNDQCAAFIASDIKTAIHEGIANPDIVAGLVYSICMNYANRVKGNRPMGNRVFMQGGVCYNRAVPAAMAVLTGKAIIVPPEPGLMGAYGVALEVKKRLAAGLLAQQRFDLKQLVQREVKYHKTFTCKGGRDKCDRRCEIARIELEGRRYPFGGACNRYDNIRHRVKYDVAALDLVRVRQQAVFEKHAPAIPDTGPGRVAINRSFLVHTYYPLYAAFFRELGLIPILPTEPTREGIDRRNAPFCYPGELAHGFFHSLLQMDPPPEFIFLPHFKAVPASDGNANSQVCPLVQGETFYLQTTFKKEIRALEQNGTKLLAPLLDLTGGMANAAMALEKMARQMGIGKRVARKAFESAHTVQQDCLSAIKATGKKALAALDSDPDRMTVVIFGRPYNAFSPEAHMGIPHKFASRGVQVIPMDMLPLEGEASKRHMYWGMGQQILMAARFVARHPRLFGCYITNFSCGPDSFVLGYFRSIMGRKPALTLELDSHTADAGIETRIEAFLDIVAAHGKLQADGVGVVAPKPEFRPAHMVLTNDMPMVQATSGEQLPFTDPRVTLLIPSMGKLSSEAFAAAGRGLGYHAVAHDPSDEAVLKLGRANTTCKECLPLILTTGTLLNYVNNRKRPDEVVVYFMPTGCGPCRFGQYYIFMEDLVKRLEIPDTVLITLSGDTSYSGLDKSLEKRGWWALAVADAMEDIRSMLLANAVDTPAAVAVFDGEWLEILAVLETGKFSDLEVQLRQSAARLACIDLKRPPGQVPTVALTGEIFVRRDALSRQNITEKLAKKGFATLCSPITEWIHYTNYMVENGFGDRSLTPMQRLRLLIRNRFMRRWEKKIKTILSVSGLLRSGPVDIRSIIRHGAPFISPHLQGEAILTVGSAMADIATHACGVIAIGPFGCMPNRVSEAILTETMTRECKLAVDPGGNGLRACLADVDDLPFLAIESDGSPYPQLINAKLEAFCLRAERLHAEMSRDRV
jgi:predicted CoA-substrate-specific enzyme activase